MRQKNGIEEANKKINYYNPSGSMDRLIFEKINNLNNITAEIVKILKISFEVKKNIKR